MLKPTKATHQSVVDDERGFEDVSRQLRSVEADNVVPFRASRAQDHSGAKLGELEAENAALRNLAVELALEIRDLYDGKGRPQA